MKLTAEKLPNKIQDALENLNYTDDFYGSEDENNYIYINYDKVISLYDKIVGAQIKFMDEMNQAIYDELGRFMSFNPNSTYDLRRVFIVNLKFPEERFMHDGKVSFQMKVLEKLNRYNPSPFITALIEWKKLETDRRGLMWYYNNCEPLTGVYNNEGDRVSKVRPFYSKDATLRLETNEPNIQNTHLVFCDIITAPAGWVIVQVDSGQIEPRIWFSNVIKDPLIKWLITEYDDAYYALADYCMRDTTDYNDSNLFRHGNLSKSIRDTLKLVMLSGNYGKSKTSIKLLFNKIVLDILSETSEGKRTAEEINNIPLYEALLASANVKDSRKPEIASKLKWAQTEKLTLDNYSSFLSDRYIQRILSHPQRKRLEKQFKNEISEGDRIARSPFGDELAVYGRFDYIFNCKLNNPMQIGVARLSAISICSGFDFIKSIPNGQDTIRYAFQKHDECIYYVRVDKVEEYLPTLIDFRSYEVDDWIPIKGKATVGLDYQK